MSTFSLRLPLTFTAVALGVSAYAGTVIGVPQDHATIQAAIDAAQPGEIVEVAAGTWTGPGNRDLRFNGKAIVVRSADGPAATTIDCEASYQDPHRAFVFDAGETRDAIVEGFTIVNGSTEQGAIDDRFNGGAILIRDASPTILDCDFRDNLSGCWGGAVYHGFSGDALISGCTFEGNHSDDDGGALFVWQGGHMTVVNSAVVRNTARVTGGGLTSFGGGDGSGGFTLVNVTVVENDAPNGAGLFVSNDTTLVNSIVWNNTGDVDQIRDWNQQTLVSYSNVMGGWPGVGNADTDPLFRSDGYHLSPGSPCVDAGLGVPLALAHPDLDGGQRRIGLGVDMGADELRFRGERTAPQTGIGGVSK